MNRRPAGAPIVTWGERQAWLGGFADDDGWARLVAHFAPAVARQVARFALYPDLLLLVAPSLGGDCMLAAAHILRASGLRPRVAVDRRFRDPAFDAADLADRRRAALARLRRGLAKWGGTIETVETARPAPLLVDASHSPFVPFDTPWRWEDEWLAAWRALHRGAVTTLAIDRTPFSDNTGHSVFPVGEHPTFRVTIALGALAEQHALLPGADCAGHVLIATAEPPIESRWRVLGRPTIAPPPPDAHKYTRGMVVVVSGAMPGAARLAARAAAASGAGYVVLAGADRDAGLDAVVHRAVASPAALTTLLDDARIGAVVIGPGLGTNDMARAWLDAVLASDRRLVLDADALTLIGRDTERIERDAETWITPHLGEWHKLTGEGTDEFGKLAHAAWWAEAGFGIIHKGADTVIATPRGAGVLDRVPPSWLSTAGTGDVLAGVLAARMAARGGDWDCGHEAAWLHGRAAELAGPAFTADRLIDHLSAAIGECR